MRWFRRRAPKSFAIDVLSNGIRVMLKITADDADFATIGLTGKDARVLAGALLDAARACGGVE